MGIHFKTAALLAAGMSCTPLVSLAAADVQQSQPTTLGAIEVTGTRNPPPYHDTITSTATRTSTPIINVPQFIQVIPRQVFVDQGAESLDQAMRNAPGVYVQQGEGNRDEFYIRGVKTKSDFFINGLRDDTEYFRPLYNIAHVDVLQGPAALLFGRGGAGGIINLVTKKPERRNIRNFSVTGGSLGQFRGTADVGGALSEHAAYRVMAMGEDSTGFRDDYFLRRYAINPRFSFQLGNRTTLDLGASFLHDERRADRGIPSQFNRPSKVSRDTFFGSKTTNVARSRVSRFHMRLKHTINDHLKVRNAFLATQNARMYQNAYPGGPLLNNGALKFSAYHHPSRRLTLLDRTEMVASFNSGILHHKLLGGIEYSWQRGKDMETLPGTGSKSLGTFSAAQVRNMAVSFPFLDRRNHVIGNELGLYTEDQLSLGKHWKALLGVRWDRFSVNAHYLKPGTTPAYTHHVDTKWSPRAGLIYKPVQNDSIYASFTQTFTPQGANIALSQKSPKTANLAAEKATNLEIGNKLDLFDDQLSITAALFQLDLRDVVATDPLDPTKLVNTGRQRNRGFELSATGAITPDWSIYANYTYLDASIRNATKSAQKGARVGLVPKHQFSVWTRYALTPHWGVGGGVHGGTKRFTSFDNDVKLPGYAIVGLMGYYRARNYRVQLNLGNLTDKTYYATASGDNQIMPGDPRSASVTLHMYF